MVWPLFNRTLYCSACEAEQSTSMSLVQTSRACLRTKTGRRIVTYKYQVGHKPNIVQFVILSTKALYCHKLRDKYIYVANTRYQVHTRYTHACGVCGLFSWSVAARLLAFSSRQFALIINHGPFFVRFTLYSLPEQE